MVTKCLGRKLAWCNRTNQAYDCSFEQYSLYPRALADEYDNPHKSSKSTWTDKLCSRYLSALPTVFTSTLPQGWVPQTVVLDAMFLINNTPLRRHRNITDYTQFIFSRFVIEHYKAGVHDVHLTFDKPDSQIFNPKMFEQGRRDTNTKSTP